MKHLPYSLAGAGLLLIGLSTTPTLAAQDKGPAAPTSLWAAQTSPTTITLVWHPVPGAAQYIVFGPRSKVGSADVTPVELVRLGNNALRYVAQMVGAGVPHWYSVQAVDAKGQVSPKAEFNPVVPPAKMASATTVPAPQAVKAEVTGPGEITLTWDAVPGATAYTIARGVRPNGLGKLCELCPTETRYVDHEVVAGAVHVYRIVAIAPQGVSRPVMSNEVTPAIGKEAVASSGGALSDPKDGLPKAPSGLRAQLISPGSIQLTWTPGVGATVFQIKRKAGLVAAQLIATVDATVTSFLDHLSGALGGVVSYEVIAVNAKGAAAPVTVSIDPAKSGTDSVVPGQGATVSDQPSPPSDLKAAVSGPDKVTLTWTGTPGTSYEIRRSIGGGVIQGVGRAIAGAVRGVVQFMDRLPPAPWAKSQSIVYTVVAVLGSGAGGFVADSKGASVTVTIDPQKAGTVSSPTGTSPADSAPEGDIDSLPRPKGRVP